MHLIFFDEVKQQPDYPYYHLGAVCVHESSYKVIEKLVNEISEQVFGDFVLKPETEFHAVDIFHRKSNFKQMADVKKRWKILISLLEILDRKEIDLIRIQINTDNLRSVRYAPDYAFMFLCERANALMKVKKSTGLLIGDREDESTTRRFSVALSQYRSKGTEFAYKMDITNLFESVHFTPSYLSRFLQLADIYSWICQFNNRYRNEKSKHSHFFEAKSHIQLFPSKYKIWPG